MTFDVSDFWVEQWNNFLEIALVFFIVVLIIIIFNVLYISWVIYYHIHWNKPWEYDYLEDMRFPGTHSCKNGLVCFLIIWDIILGIFLSFIISGYLNGDWRW